MLIRCKLTRAGGTTVDLGKGKDARHYHFKPRDEAKPDEEHVCDVNNQDDVATFLAIREAYEVHASEVSARAKAPPKPPEKKSDADPNTPEAGTESAQANGEAPLEELSKDELIARVHEKTGKTPHFTTSRTKLIAMLQEE
jgi:hypothetical protein